jgi:tRNA (guanine-N7-)-methyltransferase
MTYKNFVIPDAAGAPPPDAEQAARKQKKALIGGDVALRRQHVKASVLAGKHILDPVFHDADREALRAFCADDPARPLVVEIGFQLGECAAGWLPGRPEVRWVGIEVRKKFVEDTAALFAQNAIEHARIVLSDARALLPDVVAKGTLDVLHVFYPDPWWKPRHIKKRLVTPEFAAMAADLLRPGGHLLFKTDVDGYAAFARDVLQSEARWTVEELADPTAGLPPTLREIRCLRYGNPTWALRATRLPD